ncbi:inorganic phosphate transporter [Kocuria palustris]|uniref:inorganic phosphate transporter n=1 Tax=Kocuria palustris TaxID=71999 RepID=UPI0011AA3455|nr:inorganic phosphate transporter [Kocuria palustris]
MLLAATVVALLLAVAFAVISSGHDVSNAIAVPVRHRALGPRTALWLAAALNAVGVGLAMLLMPVHELTARGAQLMPARGPGLLIVCSALVVSIGWALETWRRGMPVSMGATLTSALLGASAASAAIGLAPAGVDSAQLLLRLFIPVLVGPLAAFALAWLVLIPVVHVASRFEADQVTMGARAALAIGSTAVNLSHGALHGPRMIALITAIVLSTGAVAAEAPALPISVALAVALALAGGSLLGGWHIARTISSRMVRPDAVRGATAQLVAGALVLPVALGSDLELSTSQTTSSAVLGAGINQRFRSTHHVVVVRILLCWLLTVPVCALASAVLVTAASPLLAG